MTSVFAIVSRAVFEQDARVGGRLPKIGEVWGTARYVSTHKGLSPLSTGGSLYLVTVRPPDERLWLVAVLTTPTFDGTQWVAAPNAAPITDLTDLIGRLRFSTGKGLSATPGKLGMALQTPRQLTPDDVALLDTAASGLGPADDAPTSATSPPTLAVAPPTAPAPAAPLTATTTAAAADPCAEARSLAAASVDPAVIKSLDALAARARAASARASKGFKEAAKKLGNAPEAVAVLDWGAEVLRERHPDHAAPLFKAARALERRLKLKVDEAQRAASMRRMAAASALEHATLLAWLKDLTAARTATMVDTAVEVVGAWAERGSLSLELLEALDKLGKASSRRKLGESTLIGLLGRCKLAAPEVWQAHADAVANALRADMDLARWATFLFPQVWPTTSWCAILERSGCVATTVRSAEDAARWIGACVRWSARARHEASWAAWFDATLQTLEPHLRGLFIPASELSTDNVVSVEAVDVLLAHGVAVGRPEQPYLDLHRWANLEQRRPLLAIAADPTWRELLYDAWEDDLLARWVSSPTPLLRAALTAEGLRPVVRRMAERLSRLGAEGTLASLTWHLERYDRLLTPDVLAASPELREAVVSIDVASLLARTFQHGIMDEWCWPAQDAANDSLPDDVGQYELDGPFPWLVMNHGGGTVIVLGPEGEHLRRQRPEALPETSRSLRVVHDDILYFCLKGSLRIGHWFSQPDAPFETVLYETWTVGVPTPEGGIWEGWRTLHAGARRIATFSHPGPFFSDGERFWAGRVEIDPDSGEAIGQGLPPWLAEVEERGEELLLDHCAFYPVPAHLDSPLGQRDGQYGLRVFKTATGEVVAEGIDGRRAVTPRGLEAPRALMRMPGREGLYPYIHQDHETSLWLPDGTPIIPPVHSGVYQFWRGAGQWLVLPWWHYLVPRDPRGTESLKKCNRDQALALLDAARDAVSPPASTAIFGGDGKVLATLQTAPSSRKSPLSEHPAVAEACRAAFPEVSAPRLRAGMVHLATRAAHLGETVTRWHAAIATAPPPRHQGLNDTDAAALLSMFGSGWGYAGTDFEASVRDAEAWLSRPPEEGLDGPVIGAVSPSRVRWDLLFLFLGAAIWRLLAPGTPPDARDSLRRALTLWRQTLFARHPERFRVFRCTVTQHPAGMDLHTGEIGQQWPGGNRLLLRTRTWEGTRFQFAVLEYDEAGQFIDPPGAEIHESYEGATLQIGAAQIDAALAALDERGPFEVPSAVVERITAATGVLPATAALLWAGAAGPWPADAPMRKLLKLPKADAELALTEVPPFVEPLYARALPPNVAALYAPLDDDGTGQRPIDRFIAEWVAHQGVRTPLDTETIRQLEADLHTRTEPFHFDVRLFEDPDRYAFLTQDTCWVVRPWTCFQSSISYMRGVIPEGWPKHAAQPPGVRGGAPDVNLAFSGWVLRRFLRYIPWAHLELPVGHRHRAALARVCALITERLRHPELLLLAGAIDLSEQTDPEQLAHAFAEVQRSFEGAPYLAADGGPSAKGLDRGDLVVTWPDDVENSFFIAVRPSRLTDPAAIARMAADLGFYDAFHRTGGGCTCGLNFGNHKVIDFTELPHYLIWISDGFQRLVAALDGTGLREAAFEADPRVSAPAIVEEVRRTLDLDELAATAYLQHLTLPEPTPERLRRYDGWSAATFNAAVAPLATRGLLVQGAHDGTRRTLFLPGEMAFPAKPAVPLEASRLPLYGLEPNRWGKLVPPFGVVLPLRPLGELFEAAWKTSKTAQGS